MLSLILVPTPKTNSMRKHMGLRSKLGMMLSKCSRRTEGKNFCLSL